MNPKKQPDREGERPDMTRSWDTVAGNLAGAANQAFETGKAVVHDALQGFVSAALYGETKTPEIERKEPEPDRDPGLDR
jgi:hypothetical protein